MSISGRIDLSDADAEDEKNRKRIVLLSFPKSAGKVQMNLKNLNFISPQNTPKGADDNKNSCNAKGGDGSDGLRLRAIAWGIDINNVTIQLTKGGDGGDATTKDDCDPGVAVGGIGGDSGNMKFTAAGRLVISGLFHIIPGKGGNAVGGSGGNASLTVFGTPSPVYDVGGNGGDAEAFAGAGGKGGDCDPTGPGGDGGDSVAAEGKGGNGDTAGEDGDAIKPGGDGGNGCLPGAGGLGGLGDPKGDDGEDGKNLCVDIFIFYLPIDSNIYPAHRIRFLH